MYYIGMVTSEQIKEWIEAGLTQSSAQVTGDGHHFEAIIIASAFQGKNPLQRHRLVYAALGERMRKEIHALSLQTFTPEEVTQ